MRMSGASKSTSCQVSVVTLSLTRILACENQLFLFLESSEKIEREAYFKNQIRDMPGEAMNFNLTLKCLSILLVFNSISSCRYFRGNQDESTSPPLSEKEPKKESPPRKTPPTKDDCHAKEGFVCIEAAQYECQKDPAMTWHENTCVLFAKLDCERRGRIFKDEECLSSKEIYCRNLNLVFDEASASCVPKTRVETKTETEARVETKTETKTEAKVETKTETKTEATVATKTETKTETKVETKTETKVITRLGGTCKPGEAPPCGSKAERECIKNTKMVWHQGRCLLAAQWICESQNRVYDNGYCVHPQNYTCMKFNQIYDEATSSCVFKHPFTSLADLDTETIARNNCEASRDHKWIGGTCVLIDEYVCKKNGGSFHGHKCHPLPKDACLRQTGMVWEGDRCLSKKEHECSLDKKMLWTGEACLSQDKLRCEIDSEKVWEDEKCQEKAEYYCQLTGFQWADGACVDPRIKKCEDDSMLWHKNRCISKEEFQCISVGDAFDKGTCIPAREFACMKLGKVFDPVTSTCLTPDEIFARENNKDICVKRTEAYKGTPLYAWDDAEARCKINPAFATCDSLYTIKELLSVAADKSRHVYRLDGERVVKETLWSEDRAKDFDKHLSLHKRAEAEGLAPKLYGDGPCIRNKDLVLYISTEQLVLRQISFFASGS